MFPAFRLRRILRIKCMGNRFWRRCEKNREKIQKATGAAPASPRDARRAAARSPAVGKSPLEIYKDIIESNQNAAFELAEAERLAEEARRAHDAFLADQDGDVDLCAEFKSSTRLKCERTRQF